jgi:hypothetical protein
MPTNRKHITAVLEDDSEAKAFIHGKNNAKVLPHSPPATQEAGGLDSRSPYAALRKISVRIPEDLDDTLSQISQQRIRAFRQGKLPAGYPCEKQEIVAEAVHEWIKKQEVSEGQSS